MKFIIPGAPIPKARPRAARRGNFVTMYNCQKQEDAICISEMKNQLQDYLNSFFPGDAIDLPLYDVYFISMAFYVPIPSNWRVAQKKHLLNEIKEVGECRYATNTKDIDNYIKFYLDCGNGVLWQDDCRIAAISAVKYYSPSPRTEIDVTGSFLSEAVKKVT